MHGGRRLKSEDENARQSATKFERITLALVLVLAFVLRARRIEDFYIGPDDGAYLHSAQIDVIQPGIDPLRWVKEDVAWIGWFAEHYHEETVTYPHSYLHQFCARYLFRFGCGALQAIRMSSALTGILTAFFAWWFIARLWPARRRVGLIAAACVAVMPVHAFLSRTGWGQVGFGCFYLAYCTLLYRVLFVIEDGDRRAFRRAGIGLAVTSLLAFGWHEGVAPYIVGSGIVVLLAPVLRGGAWSSILSRRTWTYVWSALPVGLLMIAIASFSAFAQKLWIAKAYPRGVDSWGQLKALTLDDLFVQQRADLQVTWIVLALALAGLVATWRARRIFAVYVALSAVFGSAILFCFFTDANLLRIYMPVFTALAIFAAFGFDALASTVRRGGPIVMVALLAVVGWTTWTSLFGRIEDRFFVQHLYKRTAAPNYDYRDVDRPILDHLSAHRKPADTVGVFGDKAAIFRLQDVGVRATENYLEGPPETWPAWIVAVRRVFHESPHTIERGGAYRYVIRDTIDRWNLYERVSR